MPGTTQALSKTIPDTTQALSRYFLWTAFISTDPGNAVLVCPCSDASGSDWAGNTATGQSSSLAPSLAALNGQLYCAYVADDGTDNLYVTSTADGTNWAGNTNTGHSSSAAPSLAVFSGQLYCAYVGADDTNVYVTSSAAGANWAGKTPTGHSSKAAPSLATLNGQLYVAYVGADADDTNVYVTSSADGATWSGKTPTGQYSKVAPSLAAYNGRLYVAYVADDGTDNVYVTSSADGVNWTGNTNTGQSSYVAPSLTPFPDGQLYCAYVAAIAGDPPLLICSSSDGVNWTGNTNTGQLSNVAPSLATAPFSTPLYLNAVVTSGAMLNVGDANLSSISQDLITGVPATAGGVYVPATSPIPEQGFVSQPGLGVCGYNVTFNVSISANWSSGASWTSAQLQEALADALWAVMQAVSNPTAYENYSYTLAFSGVDAPDTCVDPTFLDWGHYVPQGIQITAYNNSNSSSLGDVAGQVTVNYTMGDQSGENACDIVSELGSVLAVFPPTSELAAIVGAATALTCPP